MEKKIQEVIKNSANRMKDPELIRNIVLNSNNQNPLPLQSSFENSRWSNLSLADGYPGIIPLFCELHCIFPNEGWNNAIYDYVLKIKEGLETNILRSLSIFNGLAGICFALQQASKCGLVYKKLISKLNILYIEKVKTDYLILLQNNLKNKKQSPFIYFELIDGLSGIGVYGLNNLEDPYFLILTQEIVHLLLEITKPLEINGQCVPGWYIPVTQDFNKITKKLFPNGSFNLGLSHGITGVLAFLSISLLRGIELPGQKEAIERIVEWIQKKRRITNGYYFWESSISFEEEIRPKKEYAFTGRDAWCYGSPGVSRSLFLAGKALKNKNLKDYALSSFQSIFKRNIKEWFLPGPSICHGISGLLMITDKMEKETKNSDLKNQVNAITELLLQFYQEQHPFGFKDLEPCRDNSFFQINRPGLLEGTSGILLTLLSLNHSTHWWEAPFLISDGLNNTF